VSIVGSAKFTIATTNVLAIKLAIQINLSTTDTYTCIPRILCSLHHVEEIHGLSPLLSATKQAFEAYDPRYQAIVV